MGEEKKEEKVLVPLSFDEILLFGFLYVCFGIITGTILDLALGLIHMGTVAEVIAVVLLWPLFAIKYIALGVWAVLSAGYYLLV